MESAARADVPVDANVQHALATADVLNLAAQRDADLEVAYAGVKCSKYKKIKTYRIIFYYIII